MRMLPVLIFLSFLFSLSCNQPKETSSNINSTNLIGKGPLLTTRFSSLEELTEIIKIEYSKNQESWVRLSQSNKNQEVVSVLEKGINETDILSARDGDFLDRVILGLNSPFFVMNRNDLMKVYILSRRRNKNFGYGDVAFYDIAEKMKNQINEVNLPNVTTDDLSDKGYINTFNHINAQAVMTSIFSEELADFIADTHERTNMPELITGKFSEEQLADLKSGPVDNYIDIINNEWGQELGKALKIKYNINRDTHWTPELLVDYLNDLQSYYSYVFQIGFEPFRIEDELIQRFSEKINLVMEGMSGVR